MSRSSDAAKKSQTYLRFLNMYKSEIISEGLWSSSMAHYHIVIGRKYLKSRNIYNALYCFVKATVESPAFVLKGLIKNMFGY
jgi:hypothetical protein